MPGYYRLIPEYIASHPSLTAEEKLFYSFITSLMTKFGFCWASNKYLAEETKVSISTVKRYLSKLAKNNLLIIELECWNERKIWTPETWGNRENLLKAYGEKNINCTENLNQRFYTQLTNELPPSSNMNPYIIESTNKREKHIEAWAKPPKQTPQSKPIASVSSSDSEKPKQLLQQMTGPPPTPGPKEMADETTSLLQSPIKIGAQKFLMHPKDIPWFQGFSPTLVGNAVDRASKESWQGKRISQFVPYLFKICCNLRKNQ